MSCLKYKKFYNKDRGLPEPVWGARAFGLQCPTCGSRDMYFSGSQDDPEEMFGAEGSVRCSHCGWMTDWYEAWKQKENHLADTIREVVNA